MEYITAKRNTALTKKPLSSTHEGNTTSPVPMDKVYGVDSFGEEKNGKLQVELSYGAGSWWIYKPHWKIPKNFNEKHQPNKGSIFDRKPYPNSKEGNIQRIIEVCKDFDATKAQAAYMLATTRWETVNTFKPVIEAYWLSESWRKRNLRYYPYYGRGHAQLTWDFNYQKYEDLIGLPLVEKPNLVLDPDISAFILVHGSLNGIFTGLALPEYVATRKRDWVNARRVINGTDKAHEIANIAEAWYQGNTLRNY